MPERFRRGFAAFSGFLEKARRRLQGAQDRVESAEKRTGRIGRRLGSFRGTGDGGSGE